MGRPSLEQGRHVSLCDPASPQKRSPCVIPSLGSNKLASDAGSCTHKMPLIPSVCLGASFMIAFGEFNFGLSEFLQTCLGWQGKLWRELMRVARVLQDLQG
jgi:hypothetical protein